jgi:hypothetical protein
MSSIYTRSDLRNIQHDAQERRTNEIRNNIFSIIQRIQKDVMKEVKDGNDTKYKHIISREKSTFYINHYDEIMSKLNETFPDCDIKMMRAITHDDLIPYYPNSFSSNEEITNLLIVIDWS